MIDRPPADHPLLAGLSTIRVSVTPPTARITLARPEALNAISVQMRDELLAALEALAALEVRVAVLTGQGRAFCAGGDVGEMAGERSGADVARSLGDSHELLLHVARSPVVCVAAVNGLAYGAGFSLALACDVAVAAGSARFCLAFSAVGLVPDMGAVAELGRLLGRQRAAYLMLTNRTLSAAEAHALGVVAAVWDDGDFADEVDRLAGDIAGRSPVALVATKALVRSTFPVDLAALELEKQLQAQLSTTAEHRAAAAAFTGR